jgi:hypothetical protein
MAVEQLHGDDRHNVMYARISYVRLSMLPKRSVNEPQSIARAFILRLLESVVHANVIRSRDRSAIFHRI